MSFHDFMMQILRYLTDFGVQLFVAEILFCFTLKKKKFFAARTLFAAALLCVLPFAFDFYSAAWLAIDWFTLSFLLVFALSVLLIWLCFDVPLLKALILGIASYMTQHFAHCVALAIIGLTNMDVYFYILLTRFLSCAAMYTAFYFIFARRIKNIDYIVLDNVFICSISVITLFLVYALNQWSTALNGHYNITVRIYAALCCTFLLSGMFGMFERNRVKREKEEIESVLKMQGKQRQISKDTVEAINMYCHDFKRRIADLYASGRDARDKVSEIGELVASYENAARTGNETLDAILTERELRCLKYGIHFSYMADGEKLNFMNVTDVYSVFANAIDNAMESVVREPDTEKRLISLVVCAKNNFLCIDLENHCCERPKFKDGLPSTTKGDERFHGFGVRSIKYITEKYNGNLLMGVEDDKFYLKIIIPIPA